MSTEDTNSVKTIKADVTKKDFTDARKETEKMEARHTNDDCNMSITEIISALANKDARAADVAIKDFVKWYSVNVNY